MAKSQSLAVRMGWLATVAVDYICCLVRCEILEVHNLHNCLLIYLLHIIIYCFLPSCLGCAQGAKVHDQTAKPVVIFDGGVPSLKVFDGDENMKA